MPWTFFLTITNVTDRDLVVSSSNLNWGDWYTNSSDDNGPVTVPAGQTVQAVGVRAASGTWTGYEFSCVWTDKVPPGATSYGAINLYIDVPFSGSNNSSCTANGLLTIEGWKPLPSDGYNFVSAITINTPILAAMRDYKTPKTANDKDAPQYEEYFQKLYSTNPKIEDWSSVQENLKEVKSFNINDNIPQKVELISTLLARSQPYDIEPQSWQGIGDPVYRNSYAQKVGV